MQIATILNNGFYAILSFLKTGKIDLPSVEGSPLHGMNKPNQRRLGLLLLLLVGL
jgi:hypothetical protein